MRRVLLLLTLVGAILLACAGVVLAQSTTPDNRQQPQSAPGGQPSPLPGNAERVCPKPTEPGKASCHALRRTDVGGGVHPKATTSYTKGYGPSDLKTAYSLPTASGSGKTISIVDAYDNPNALQDLKVYREQFGLPTGPTVTKMNQSGKIVETLNSDGSISKPTTDAGTAPAGNTGWGQEIALDLDMANAVCPNCNILLVEANSNSLADLGAAVNTAAKYDIDPTADGIQPVAAISNSYGANEFSSEANYESPYNHAGIAVTVSSGDNGYGVEFPAASRYVTAVGGTSLTSVSPRAESAWSGAGSGCSSYIPKPSFQTDKGCSKRTVADVSAVADPNTGVAVYDSYGSTGGANWYVFGGTSVAAPIIASVYALAGNTISYGEYPYDPAHASGLNDVTSGSNGHCANKRTATTSGYLCTAGTHYDGPTGLGTPNGTGAF